MILQAFILWLIRNLLQAPIYYTTPISLNYLLNSYISVKSTK